MKKILISACLLGDKVKYNGKGNYTPLVEKLKEQYDLVLFCPEVEGGLPIPRNPSEIKNDEVFMNNGRNVTKNFVTGAKKALMICQYLNIKVAILKDGSPSCGSNEIHDGNFKGNKIPGKGITTRLLEKNGIKVYSENQIELFLDSQK